MPPAGRALLMSLGDRRRAERSCSEDPNCAPAAARAELAGYCRSVPASTRVVVFVEIPGGSRNKYEVDAGTGAIFLDRRLFTSMSYPADYGFIEGTLGDDEDPLDALVLVGDPTFPGCRIHARPVGVFYMTDEKGRDEKIICVADRDTVWGHVHDIHDIQPEFRDEIEHFFSVYKDLEEKKTEVRGFGNRAKAVEVIDEARRRLSDAGSRR